MTSIATLAWLICVLTLPSGLTVGIPPHLLHTTRDQMAYGRMARGRVVRGEMPREQVVHGAAHQGQPVHDHMARGQAQRGQVGRGQADRRPPNGRQMNPGEDDRGHADRGQGVRGQTERGQVDRGPRPNSSRSSRTNTSQLPVVFPEELRPRLNDLGLPDCATSAGRGSGAPYMELSFCDDDAAYPTEAVKRAMREVNVDLSDNTLLGRQPLNHEESIDQRVCETKRRTIYPKTARNSDREWVYVVNDVEYAQAVTTEVCAKEDSQCEFVANALPSGYTSGCRQKFANRKLLALHPTEKKAYADNFPFPSCCVCYVRAPPLGSRTFRGRK